MFSADVGKQPIVWVVLINPPSNKAKLITCFPKDPSPLPFIFCWDKVFVNTTVVVHSLNVYSAINKHHEQVDRNVAVNVKTLYFSIR